MHHPVTRTSFPVPPVVKRNTLFAHSQSFTGAGMQLAFGLGPLMVVALTDSASLAGLCVGIFGMSRFLVSYSAGRITRWADLPPAGIVAVLLAVIPLLMRAAIRLNDQNSI